MKKSDLKSGMIVELRGYGTDNLGLLIETDMGLIIQFNYTFGNLYTWEETLEGCDDEFDIVAVRKPTAKFQYIREHMHKAPIIWERK